MTKYVCRNYGSCAKADAREEIELVPGAEPVCECGFELTLVESDGSQGGRRKKALLVVGGVLAVAVLAGVSVLMTKSDSPKAASAFRSSTAPTSSTATGVAPDAEQLTKAKAGVDAAIKAGAGASTAVDQRVIIARELVKAAIPLMQSGKWAEAQAQLDKAKAEFADEPLIYINQAILSLKQSRASDALAHVETAVQKGFRDFAILESDADLKSLTASDAYKKLVARYPAK